MHGKAIGWLGNILGWGQRQQATEAEKLYSEAVRLARNPIYFGVYGVVDDVDGRFDMLSLVVTLVMRRLKAAGDAGKARSQELFDSMFADMDLSLREMGAGDIGVSKRIRTMAEAFIGRFDAYVTALDKGDSNALAAALKRNVFRGNDQQNLVASGLVEAVLGLVTELDRLDDAGLLEGRIDIG